MGRISRKARSMTEHKENQVVFQWLAASYSRLSNEDSRKGQSLSNQKKLIREFAERNPNVKIVAEYEDNGRSGTNFNRAGFEQMMEAVKSGEVNCIIVKDLSRFGRDFIETGNYIERVFPHIGVRFIAINDNYDSDNPECTTEYLVVALKNLINELYVKDISKKIQTVKHLQQERGEFLGNCPPYGYRFEGMNKKKLFVDPETAETVRMIFALRESGMTCRKIAQYLQEQGIKSPWLSLKEKGYTVNVHCKCESMWHPGVIAKMLSNKVYTGSMVQRKTVTSYYEGKECKKLPEEKWIIIPDCHEAIIGREQFERVNAMKRKAAQDSETSAGQPGGHENMFKGILFCGDCGYAMSQKKIIPNRRRDRNEIQPPPKYSYTCKKYAALGKECCTSKHIMEDKLVDIVSSTVLPMIRQICQEKAEHEMVPVMSASARKQEVQEKQQAEVLEKIGRCRSLKAGLYESYASGFLTKTDYLYTSEQYDKEISFLKEVLEKLQRDTEQTDQEIERGKTFFKTIQQYEKKSTITPELIRDLIEKIEVFDNKRIQITFRFADLYGRGHVCGK